jgi:hypothetical protein
MTTTREPTSVEEPLVPYNLLRQQADIVAALLRYLVADERHWRNWTIEGAVSSALDLDREPTEEQYDQGCDLLSDIAVRLEHRGTGRYRLAADEARLLAEVLDDVLRSPYDWDFRIESAVADGLELDDAPTGRQHETGEWAIEQARVRLNAPDKRPDERAGDVLQVEVDGGVEGLAAGGYEIVAVSPDALIVALDDGSLRALSRTELEDADAWVERRFLPSPLPLPELPAREPVPKQEPWTIKELQLRNMLWDIRGTCQQILSYRRDVAACENGTFPTGHPERTANKFRNHITQAEERLRLLKRLTAEWTAGLRGQQAAHLDEILRDHERAMSPEALAVLEQVDAI